MPRPKPRRSIGGEQNLAERIRRELSVRDWSPAELGKRMTEAGCSIGTSSVYKVLDDEKPRTISVDELLALADVFGTTTDDLLTPVEALDQRRAKELLQSLDEADERIMEGVAGELRAMVELFRLACDNRELHDYVVNHRYRRVGFGAGEITPLFQVIRDDDSEIEVSDATLRDALTHLASAVIEQASEIVMAEVADDEQA